MSRYLLDKIELAKYVAVKHEKETGNPIGRIRLQKTLYFLYAYWIKQNSSIFTSQSLGQNSELDTSPKENFKMLFQQEFQAWAYGPVDVEVYSLQKIDFFQNISEKEYRDVQSFIDSTEPFVLDFINTYLEAINQLNDFTLVDISHSDSAWRKNYNKNNPYNSTRIKDEDIIHDYTK